jgi:hypothetical protein
MVAFVLADQPVVDRRREMPSQPGALEEAGEHGSADPERLDLLEAQQADHPPCRYHRTAGMDRPALEFVGGHEELTHPARRR